VERTTLERLKKWVQHRIDYWEDVTEQHQNDFETFTDIGETWLLGLERGEEKGMLAAFYMVIECIDGSRSS
jgi:hypothetical protein